MWRRIRPCEAGDSNLVVIIAAPFAGALSIAGKIFCAPDGGNRLHAGLGKQHQRVAGAETNRPVLPQLVQLSRQLDGLIELGRRRMATWDGDFYATGLIERLGLAPDGVLRIGLTHYNTRAEVDGLLEALEDLARTGRTTATRPGEMVAGPGH